MKFFTELFNLIKWLFISRPGSKKELEIVQMKYFPFSGYLAMSWCGKLITRNPEKIDESTVRHETTHLKQAQRYPLWVFYYIVYVYEWIKGKPLVTPSNSAYYTIPFEVEAYANEDKPGYNENYDKTLLKSKYTFKDRKNLYKQYGTPYMWKKYISTL